MSATAPAGYAFAACGGSDTIASPPTAASTKVTVPKCRTGTGLFYVTPLPVPTTPTSESPPVTTPSSLSLIVAKTNDANGSGVYAQTETAQNPDENVPFRVVVTNNSSGPETITSLTDAWPGQAPFSPTCADSIDSTTLEPGDSTACDFTLAGYGPAVGGSAVTDTVAVDACQVGSSANCGSWVSSSTVEPAPVTSAPLSEAATPVATASSAAAAPVATATDGNLAFTGPPTRVHLMLVVGLAMASAGFFVLWFARPRRKLAGRP
ncbi:MAG TPA: hypothetical protein VK386_03575 [Acidimicrobiales bacterium]|nr:hypothetical protein [Acidimicrobiales bacterium]